MRIERITDMAEVIKCLPFEATIRAKKRETIRESKMLMFIQSVIDNPFFGYFMVYDDNDEVIGYVIGLMNLMPEMENLSIIRMVATTKEVRLLIEKTLTAWMKEYKVKKATITTNKHIKAIKRYGFNIVSVNMERRI